MLKRFGEPSWNYQVVRFLDAEGKDIIPRKDKVWSTVALAKRMIATLEKHNLEVPGYLKSLEILPAQDRSRAVFAMYCYWTGEGRLGALNGVISTESGYYDGKEVVLVEFDRQQVSFEQLLISAKKLDCAHGVYPTTPEDLTLAKKSGLHSREFRVKEYRKAGDKDQKKQIQGTRFARIKLSPAQATKVNAFARSDAAKALSWLSPTQRLAVLSR